MSQSETRTFTVSPNIIRHLISSQAGTLGKAFAECVMNSIDAGASHVDITLESGAFAVQDDGHGFRTRDEILSCFEVFGFDHSDRSRDFGRFGLGRAQLWNWCSTRWRTHTFNLDVDVRAKALDYDLVCGLPDLDGLRVDGTFYEPLSELDMARLLREVDTLCRHCVIPVVVNGRDVRRDPVSMKWTHEDDDAWIKVAETGRLSVYNQGIFVRDYNTYELGIGGTLVTKLGHVLALNMARSDVLTHECEVWKRLKKVCSTLSHKEVATKKSRMTAEQRDFLASQTNDVDFIENLDQPLFTLTNGKHVGIRWIVQMLDAGAFLSAATTGDRMAERAIQERSAVVLSERTLERFDADSVTGLMSTLQSRFQRAEHAGNYMWHYVFARLDHARSENMVYDQFSDCPVSAMLEASTVPEKEWKPAHRAMIGALNGVYPRIAHAVNAASHSDGGSCGTALRKLVVGQSNGAEAFTDGATYIAFVDRVLDEAIMAGLPGAVRLIGIMVHEQLHDTDDGGSHQHDHAFYEAFHEVMLDPDGVVCEAAMDVFRQFCKQQNRLKAKQAKQLDVANLAAAA